jgi:hypothetical protein
MGQYSQWLHYHKIDQQLQAQHARLEQDLRNLQEQAHNLEVHIPHAPNSIIQALQQHMQTGPRLTALASNAPSTHHLPIPEPSTSTAMPAVRSHPRWTPFPGMIEHSRYTNPKLPVRTAALKAAQLAPVTAITPTPTSTSLQLASSMHIIPAQDTPPPEALTYTGHARPNHRTLPVDPQDEHTDQMIQRWLERWGKHPHPLQLQQNTQNTQDAEDERD